MSQYGQNTINKSDRNIDQKFDQVEFNKQFDIKEEDIRKELNNLKTQDLNIVDEKIKTLPLHKKPTEEVIVTIRELFYKSLEILINKQNPLPFIFATPDRQFAFSILLIGIGTLLLLFSNLMISSEKDK